MEKALYDLGCRWPECDCVVPDWAFSQEVRKAYCKKYIRTSSPNKGKNMNEHIDPAFAPMEAAPHKVGLQPDGTVTYNVVEGNTYRDNEHVKPEVVGYVQVDQPEGEGH